jgi:coatomer protein complex subunit epsilon
VDEARDILLEVEGEGGEEGVVRALVGTVFILANEAEEAVATLSEGAGAEDLECIALLVQLCLALDRRDLAQGQYNRAKAVGNDSTLVQCIEAWIGLKSGARPLHQAYYFYEELYQLPNGRTAGVLAAHAAAHLLLGHADEARADIAEALERGGQDPAVLAVATSLGDADAQR